ncbi:NAD(P)-binding protein [Pseudoalteromonas sp. SaAl2]
MKTCVVVGGGVCGLTASILLKKRYDRVLLVEQGSVVGGLLSSVKDEQGNIYDQGTHIPVTTGIEEVDDIIFNFENKEIHWHQFQRLETGNYFAGSWDLETQTIDARKLNEGIYHKGVGEFLSSIQPSSATNIEAYLNETLGPTFYENLAMPVINKLYGKDVDKKRLSTSTSINYFGANRIKAFDENLTRILKQHPEIDKKLGFHKSSEYDSYLKENNFPMPYYFYPNTDGVQLWVSELVSKAQAVGVEIITNTQVKKLFESNGKIDSVELSNSEVINTELVFWSAPPVFALHAGGLPIHSYRPTFRTAYILHATFDKPLNNNKSHYLWNWDPSSEIFRITLYDNLRTEKTHSVSAEVLRDKSEAEFTLSEGVEDLRNMGLITEDAAIQSGFVQQIENTFPVPTKGFAEATEINYQTLISAYSNILVSGRFSGRCWLLHDVLRFAYEDINNYAN